LLPEEEEALGEEDLSIILTGTAGIAARLTSASRWPQSQ
jgi:hypothetical protein